MLTFRGNMSSSDDCISSRTVCSLLISIFLCSFDIPCLHLVRHSVRLLLRKLFRSFLCPFGLERVTYHLSFPPCSALVRLPGISPEAMRMKEAGFLGRVIRKGD